MRRRFNYTGRKRIRRSSVVIDLRREGGEHPSFSASLDLEGLSLPSDSRVYVEAYHRTEYQRYDFGTLEDIRPREETTLERTAYVENLKFRVLVVDETDGRGLILASADQVKPVEEDIECILPVVFRDLGQQIWQVAYDGDEGAPILLLNSRIPGIESMARRDPQFLIYVYPSVTREVLTHMVFVDGIEDMTDPSLEWHARWLRFAARLLLGETPPETLDIRDDGFDSEEAIDWIDRSVEGFCALHVKEWRQYIKRITEVRS